MPQQYNRYQKLSGIACFLCHKNKKKQECAFAILLQWDILMGIKAKRRYYPDKHFIEQNKKKEKCGMADFCTKHLIYRILCFIWNVNIIKFMLKESMPSLD